MKKIRFSTRSQDWKNFKTNKRTITLYVFFLASNGGLEKITPANISEHNSERKNLVILTMITDGEKWYYIAVKTYLDCFLELRQATIMRFQETLAKIVI